MRTTGTGSGGSAWTATPPSSMTPRRPRSPSGSSPSAIPSTATARRRAPSSPSPSTAGAAGRRPGRPALRGERPGGSVAEVGRPVLPACLDGLLEVVGGEADEELGEALLPHVGLQACGVQRGPQHPLGQLGARPAEPGDPLGQLVAGAEELAVRDDAGQQADALGLVRADVPPGQHDLEGAGGADRAREQVAEAEFSRREAVVDPGGAEQGGLGAEPDVGGQRQAEAAADRGPVDRGDDRLVDAAHRADDVVEQLHRPERDGGEGEPVDAGDVAGVLQVGAGAEAAAGAGDHDDAGVVVAAGLLEGLPERDHDVERHRVHPFGPVEGDEGDVRARLVDQDEGQNGPPTVPEQALGYTGGNSGGASPRSITFASSSSVRTRGSPIILARTYTPHSHSSSRAFSNASSRSRPIATPPWLAISAARLPPSIARRTFSASSGVP